MKTWKIYTIIILVVLLIGFYIVYSFYGSDDSSGGGSVGSTENRTQESYLRKRIKNTVKPKAVRLLKKGNYNNNQGLFPGSQFELMKNRYADQVKKMGGSDKAIAKEIDWSGKYGKTALKEALYILSNMEGKITKVNKRKMMRILNLKGANV